MTATPPRVLELRWGSIDTDAGTFRDAKLWPGGGRNWDWNETGTRHRPGAQVADVAELLDNGAEIIVVGCGQQRRLGISAELGTDLDARGIELLARGTQEAIAAYNRLLREGRAVGALLHSTC